MICSIDSLGNVYVCGYGFVTSRTPLPRLTGGGDAFVAKIDSDGNLLWNTFLGGTGAENDRGSLLIPGECCDSGHSTSSWGRPVRAYTGGEDAFAAKLDADGNLLWNTFLGGSAGDRGMGIVVDNTGNSFLTGYSNTTWGNTVHPYTGDMNTFVAELDSSGNLIGTHSLVESQVNAQRESWLMAQEILLLSVIVIPPGEAQYGRACQCGYLCG